MSIIKLALASLVLVCALLSTLGQFGLSVSVPSNGCSFVCCTDSVVCHHKFKVCELQRPMDTTGVHDVSEAIVCVGVCV